MKKDFIPGQPYQKITQIENGIKSVKEIDDGTWQAIRSFMVEPDDFSKEDVEVFTVNLANNQIDRDQERFSDEVLKSFVKTLPGKSLLIGHQWGPPGKGTFFKANLVTKDAETWLQASVYVLKAYSQSLIDHVKAGIWKFVSIGFSAPSMVRIPATDDPAKTMYWEYRNKDGQEAEALEGSLVWLGAQYDAQAIKKALGGSFGAEVEKFVTEVINKNTNNGSTRMILKLKHLDINEEIKTAEDLATAALMIDEEIAKMKGDATLDADFFNGVKKLFPEDEQSEVTVSTIKELKATADAYKESLLNEIVKFGKLIKMLPEDEGELEKEKQFYSGLPTERLVKQLDQFKAKYLETHPGHSDLGENTEEHEGDDADMVEIDDPVTV